MTIQFQRKASLEVKLWSSLYLAYAPLHRDIKTLCNQLGGDLLDLGCGNQPYRSLLTNISSYVAYDVDAAHSTPMVVGTAYKLPFATGSFDSVLSTQVLEHVQEPWGMLEEISRILRPGGKLLLSAPQAWRLHEEPYDFYRYTRYGLRYLVERTDLQLCTILPQGGIWSTVGQSILNTLWRNASGQKSLKWLALMVCTLFINTTSVLLDKYWFDPSDTLNYAIFAQKNKDERI